MPSSSEVEASVLKGARERCYQAKDAYYECVQRTDIGVTSGPAVPLACKRQRQQFEAACRASWVQHFDKLHEKEVRLVQTLHSNINQTKSKTGRLAGEPQPTEEQHS